MCDALDGLLEGLETDDGSTLACEFAWFGWVLCRRCFFAKTEGVVEDGALVSERGGISSIR